MQEGKIFNFSEIDKFYMDFTPLIAVYTMELSIFQYEFYIFQWIPECTRNHDFSENRERIHEPWNFPKEVKFHFVRVWSSLYLFFMVFRRDPNGEIRFDI